MSSKSITDAAINDTTLSIYIPVRQRLDDSTVPGVQRKGSPALTYTAPHHEPIIAISPQWVGPFDGSHNLEQLLV